jgi:hypothetical protein
VLGPGGWSRPIGVRALVETSEMLATCRDCIAWQSWHSCHLQSHPRRHQACMAPVFVRRGKTRDRVSLDTTLHAMLNSSRALTCLAYVMVSSEPNAPYLRLVVRGAGNASLLQIGRHRAARQPLAGPASANCCEPQTSKLPFNQSFWRKQSEKSATNLPIISSSSFSVSPHDLRITSRQVGYVS